MLDTCTTSKMATRQQMNPPILKNGNRTSLQRAGVVEVEESTLLVHPPLPTLSMAVDSLEVNLQMQQSKNG